MSILDELTTELCPNGVEYRKVGDIAKISRGKVMSKEYLKENAGEYPVYSSQTENDGKLGAITTYMFDGEYLTWTTDGANAGTVFYRSGKFSVTNVCGVIDNISKDVDTKYLYYILNREAPHYVNSGMGNPKLMSNVMARINLPVPPLEVQREIVHILDSFTLLTAELTAELTARKKQYEFYRDELLSVKKNIPIVKLGDIATEFYRGSGIKRDEVTNTGIPCVRYGEIYTTYNTWFDKCVSYTKLDFVKSPKYFENGDILFAITGESVEDIAKSVAYIGHEKCLAGGDIVVMKHKQNPRYLAHVLATTEARMQKSKGKVKSKVVHSNVPSIKEIQIPLPPLDVQEKYANVLDNFEAICTDLNIGLPAEIEARQKQYEYYRDLLLTFAEAGSTLMTDRQTDRQTELSTIKLIQYVFGYAMLPLGKVVNVFRGEYITKKNTKEGTIPVILGGQEPAYYIDKYNHDGEIVVVARSGASAGFVSYWNQKIFVTDGFGYEEKSELITTKFLYYVLKNMESELNAMKRGAGVPHVSGEMLNSIKLPIPSLQDQQRIVEILDRFDTLCNDLSAGLPAEIEARQKQYEYYRDKLLSFKELPK